ncbi:hypothetical protein BEWA_026800 [Theileria equi strain WA]|uniref:Uncharacterized protein n=1 Tax=Theileria equi strain WA TaxID=1537102 RepID=L0AXT7_THEEQ|nr:hypothetical protein BEWA_026800 [Theileria equi strain WA]AFZ79831.1 hypothetical protein BEWA_026800 [Theileria equi strain WA]|eukprot:XP_004829497.1 hypothetical protein BEWA_026800 [Theileria equi strain WA]
MENRIKKMLRLIYPKSGDSVSCGTIIEDEMARLLLISEKGKAKLVPQSEIKLQRYGGRGYDLLRQGPSGDDKLVASLSVKETQQVILVSSGGLLAKKHISVMRLAHKHHKMKKFWQKGAMEGTVSFATPFD